MKNNSKVPKQMEIEPRDRLLSYFAWIAGGWNASPGIHCGHLAVEDFYGDDEKMVRHILSTYGNHIAHPLKAEIQRLKAEVYDLERKLPKANEKGN